MSCHGRKHQAQPKAATSIAKYSRRRRPPKKQTRRKSPTNGMYSQRTHFPAPPTHCATSQPSPQAVCNRAMAQGVFSGVATWATDVIKGQRIKRERRKCSGTVVEGCKRCSWHLLHEKSNSTDKVLVATSSQWLFSCKASQRSSVWFSCGHYTMPGVRNSATAIRQSPKK